MAAAKGSRDCGGLFYTDFAPLSGKQVLILYSSGICGIRGVRHTLRMSYFLKLLPLTFRFSFVRYV